jgi:hypothetical protein
MAYLRLIPLSPILSLMGLRGYVIIRKGKQLQRIIPNLVSERYAQKMKGSKLNREDRMTNPNERPTFTGGRNVAMKVPPHQWEATVAFYRDTVGLQVMSHSETAVPSVVFELGDLRLWIDRVDGLSQAEIWLELNTPDAAAAARHFQDAGIARRDEIEPLGDDFNGFWISSPASIIHLVAGDEEA